jgi:serine/threonine protein kinase
VTDSTRPELRRAAAAIADGTPLDWDALPGAGLTPDEIRALRILEAVGRPMTLPSAADAGSGIPGGFEILGELGRGSMGRVWRALDRSLAREVALKVVEPEPSAATPSIHRRERFLEEARLLAGLRHPNIVQIHSIDEQAGRIRLVLERIEGKNLAEVVRAGGPLAPAEAARIGVELCRALAALHARGIVHRDLKPTNVMRETGGRVVLLDFGVARSDRSRRSLASDSAGTPRFMAPEQYEAQSEVGPAADLWALGVLLYWLASARFPFEGGSYQELERSVLAGRALPLVDRLPDAPAAFARILARALERDPRQRFRSAGEMEEELRGFLAGAAAADGASPRREPHGSAPARHGWKWAGLVAAGILVALLGWRLLAARAPLSIEWQLFARRSGQDVRLRSGDATHVGDMLVLELAAAEALFVYVLDEDDAGETHVLFPVPGFELGNPLAAGRTHRLPGSREGEPQNWLVTSSGGAENILVVASRGPFAPLEQMIAGLPRVEPGATPTYPEVTAESRSLVLRGIGGTRNQPALSATTQAGGRLTLLNHVFDLMDRESDPDRSVQLIRLPHGD